ncbi:MAG: DNA alkylation repair protein [Bacteroidota bacterium]
MKNPLLEEILCFLNENKNTAAIEGMKRFGIVTTTAFGVSLPILRKQARLYKNNHELALALWETAFHEARILATIIDDPSKVSPSQMDQWVKDFYSWDICDQCCGNLFRNTPYKWEKAFEWAKDEREYVRRAGFVMMAGIAIGDKKADDSLLMPFFDYILTYSTDERNFVKKAVNWALRQIGKRSRLLNLKAVEIAEILMKSENKTVQWIGKDAYRELINPSILKNIKH